MKQDDFRSSQHERPQGVQQPGAYLQTISAIVSSATSAQDLAPFLETTIDLVLRAVGCAVGGIWVGSARSVRGMSAEVGLSAYGAPEAPWLTVRDPQVITDEHLAMGTSAHPLRSTLGRQGVRAWAVVPILVQGQVVGGIIVASPISRAWPPESVMLVEVVARLVGGVEERLQLLRVIGRQAEEAEICDNLHRQLQQAGSEEEMGSVIVGLASRLLKSGQAELAMVNAERDRLTRAYAVGIPALDLKSRQSFPVNGTMAGQVLKTGTPYVSRDVSAEALPAYAEPAQYREFGPLVLVPVRAADEIIGTLRLVRPKRPDVHAFTDEEIRLAERIASVSGMAIHRARLQRHLERSYIEMVSELARVADARDRFAADHSERTARRAIAIARALGCSESELLAIYWAALLRDIGKLGIPDHILRKTGPLTEADWQIIRQHSTVGEEILRPVAAMRRVAALVRHHHERWDGSGYPDGLKANDIPLGARILAVADAYGAMTDVRAASKSRAADEAIEELRQCAGTQFDPHVVDVFCQTLTEQRPEPEMPRSDDALLEGSAVAPSDAVIARSLAYARRVSRVVPAMTDLAKNLLRPLDLSAALDEILKQIQEVFHFPICGVFFIDENTQELYVRAHRGYDSIVAPQVRLRVGQQGIVGWVARHGRPYYAPDVLNDPLYVASSSVARSNVAYPLIVADRVIGVLDIGSTMIDGFPKETRELLETFVILAALAILRAQRDEELSHLALTDGLTNLANRRALQEALEREVARATRSGRPVSVAIVEIDGFKRVNDRFGHLRGDEILQTVAAVLKRVMRGMDLAARYGGDEFVLLLPECGKSAALQVAERARHAVEMLSTDGNHLTVSVGLAGMPEDGDTAAALLAAADRAMYTAKSAGGNRTNVA